MNWRTYRFTFFCIVAICCSQIVESGAATNDLSEVWRLKLPGFASQSACAIAPDGTIYQGTFQGRLLAIAPAGKIKWQFKAGLEIWSSPAVADDGTVYFGSRDGACYAVASGGQLKWKFQTGAWVDSSPAIAVDGTVYFGSWDNKFYAVAADGKLKWTFATSNIVESSPAIASDGTIYFGSHDRHLYALSPDGRLKWAFHTGGAIISSPAIGADGSIYFSSLDGNLYALRPDGTQQWRLHTGGTTDSSPILDEQGNLYLMMNRYHLSVDSMGAVRWKNQCELNLETPAVAAANGFIFTPNPWLHLGIVDREGNEQWGFLMTENLQTAPNINTDGVVYACDGTYLFALKPANAAPLANSSWPVWRGDAAHTGRGRKQK